MASNYSHHSSSNRHRYKKNRYRKNSQHFEQGKRSGRLGLWMLIALVAGNMIGSGIFLLPASLAQIGSISLYSWILTALGSIVLALVFARMSVLVPKTGGPYAYAKAGLGDFIGFQTAYLYWAALWIGNAAIALALVGYLTVFFPDLASTKGTTFAAIGFVWVLTFINMIGIARAGVLQVISMIIKLIPLVLLILLGWFYFHPSYLTQSFNLSGQSDWVAISHGASLTLWAFIGLEAATVPQGSVENPRRNIPLATFIGVLIGAFVYIFSSLVIMGMIPADILAKSTSPFADAAGLMFGKAGLYIIGAGAAISCLGALNGWIMLQGQVAMAAADDGLFPKWFAKRNHHHVPYLGLLISSVLITLLLLIQMSNKLIDQFNVCILLAVFASVLPYLYTAAAQWLLAKKDLKNPLRRGLDIVIAMLALIYAAWALMSTGQTVLVYGMALLVSSIVLYGFLEKKI